jgi:hypothetical protein
VFFAVVPEVPGIPKTGVPLRWLEEERPRKGCIYRVTNYNFEEDRVSLPRDLGREANLPREKHWLSIVCRGSHSTCSAPKKPAGETLRGFKAINCATNDIKEIPWSESYVALSYVWGRSGGEEKWPQTIKDAVKVTRMLGEKYLWVDRLCINQSNLAEKMYFVERMDKIYPVPSSRSSTRQDTQKQGCLGGTGVHQRSQGRRDGHSSDLCWGCAIHVGWAGEVLDIEKAGCRREAVGESWQVGVNYGGGGCILTYKPSPEMVNDLPPRSWGVISVSVYKRTKTRN